MHRYGSAVRARPTAPTSVLLLAVALVLGLVVSACSTGGGSDAKADGTSSTSAPTSSSSADAKLLADRPFDVHVAPSYEQGTPAPLLVLLHGFGANGDLQEQYLGLTGPADDAGMLYVHPDGTKNRIDKQFWNATDACCSGPLNDDVDDSAYLAALIAKVRSQYTVDPKRIYVVGHSNGGFMAYRMACDHADTIAAIISLEGATFADPKDCDPSEAVATLEVHGTADTTIRYDGDEILGTAYPSAPDTVATWAAYDGCRPTPDDPAPADRDLVQGLAPATVTSYSKGCRPGGHAELWTQPGGVHIPPWSATFSQQLIDWLVAHPKP